MQYLLQVLEDQKLLRDRILHLTGNNAGLTRKDEALQDARTKYAEAAETGSSPSSPLRTPIGSEKSSSSPGSEAISVSPPESSSRGTRGTGKPKVVRSLFRFPTPVLTATPENLVKQDTYTKLRVFPGESSRDWAYKRAHCQ